MLHHEKIQPMTKEEMEQKLQQMKEERDRLDTKTLWKYSMSNSSAFNKAITSPMTKEEMEQKLQQMKEERQKNY